MAKAEIIYKSERATYFDEEENVIHNPSGEQKLWCVMNNLCHFEPHISVMKNVEFSSMDDLNNQINFVTNEFKEFIKGDDEITYNILNS